jgi:hypothetical protein
MLLSLFWYLTLSSSEIPLLGFQIIHTSGINTAVVENGVLNADSLAFCDNMI